VLIHDEGCRIAGAPQASAVREAAGEKAESESLADRFVRGGRSEQFTEVTGHSFEPLGLRQLDAGCLERRLGAAVVDCDPQSRQDGGGGIRVEVDRRLRPLASIGTDVEPTT
jgi:hypothetical protein